MKFRTKIRHFFKPYLSSINELKTTRLAITVTISLGLFALNHAAFAEDTASFAKIGVTYHPSTNVLEITGIVYKTFSQNYVLTIFNPEGRLVEVSQLQLSQDDTFSQSIVTSNTLWSEPGNYTAKLTSAPQILSEKLFYFPGASCCIKNSHGVQASPSKTSSSIDSPLKQFQSGVAAKDVHCSDDLILVIKAEDGSPACVKPDNANILIKRGWAESAINDAEISAFRTNTSNSNFTINYIITEGNRILDTNITNDTNTISLAISLDAPSNGSMTLVIPHIMDDMIHNKGAQLVVLSDGKEVINYNETEDKIHSITIPIIKGTKQIIVASIVIM